MKDKDTKLLTEAYDYVLHESICTHCGDCCKTKVIQEGKVLELEEWCPAYNKETHLCEIYENRHEDAMKLYGVRCESVEVSIKEQTHPQHCPYVPSDYKCIISNK